MGNPTVLIVDDVYYMRNLLRKNFKDGGFEVIGEAKNGREAVELYIKLKPDLVTMDITMPIMDGIEATRKIIEKDGNARIIAITASSDPAAKAKILSNGAVEYIRKPFQPAILWNKAKKALAVKPVSEKSNEPIPVQLECETETEVLEETSIDILNKPDETRPDVLYVTSTDEFTFPDEYVSEKEKFKLTKEKIEALDQELLKKSNGPAPPDNLSPPVTSPKDIVNQTVSIKPPTRNPVVTPAVTPEITISPEPPVLAQPTKTVEPEPEPAPIVESPKPYTSPVSIKPPRAKLLQEKDETVSQDELEQLEMIISKKEQYNPKNNAKKEIFGNIKNMFKTN